MFTAWFQRKLSIVLRLNILILPSGVLRKDCNVFVGLHNRSEYCTFSSLQLPMLLLLFAFSHVYCRQAYNSIDAKSQSYQRRHATRNYNQYFLVIRYSTRAKVSQTQISDLKEIPILIYCEVPIIKFETGGNIDFICK